MSRSCNLANALESLCRNLGPRAHLGAISYSTVIGDLGAGVSNPAHTAPSNRFYKNVGILDAEAQVGFVDGKPTIEK